MVFTSDLCEGDHKSSVEVTLPVESGADLEDLQEGGKGFYIIKRTSTETSQKLWPI